MSTDDDEEEDPNHRIGNISIKDIFFKEYAINKRVGGSFRGILSTCHHHVNMEYGLQIHRKYKIKEFLVDLFVDLTLSLVLTANPM